MKLIEYLLYAIIILIPTYLIRFTIFGIPTNLLEVLIMVAFLRWIIVKFKVQNSKFKITIQNAKLLVVGVLLLLVGLVLGTPISPDIQKSLGVLKGWFLFPLVFFILARSALDTQEKKEKAFLSLALSGIGVAVIGFFYWFFGDLTFDERLKAFYESPNMLAMQIAPALLIVAQALISNSKYTQTRFSRIRKQISKIFLYPCFRYLLFAFLFFILFLTHSLGASVAVGGALSLLIILRKTWVKPRGEIVKKLWIISLAVIVFAGTLFPFTSFLLNPWSMTPSSLASRLMIWQSALLMLKDNWFFGIGPGMFQEIYLAYQRYFPPYLEWAVPHPHNLFLTTWLYGGLLGLFGFLLILLHFFKIVRDRISDYRKRYRKQFSGDLPRSGSYTEIILAGLMFYILIFGFVDNLYWKNDLAVTFWLFLGLI